MDAILDIVQFGLLIICVVCGLVGVALLIVDHRRPKHKTTSCGSCGKWRIFELDYGMCDGTGQVCRAGQRACNFEKRGK